MYGTVARLRLKPEAAGQLEDQLQEFEGLDVPGYVSTTIYRMDANSSEYLMAVVFESKEAYQANAESTEQNERYVRMRELLETEPEWHDGEVVYRGP